MDSASNQALQSGLRISTIFTATFRPVMAWRSRWSFSISTPLVDDQTWAGRLQDDREFLTGTLDHMSATAAKGGFGSIGDRGTSESCSPQPRQAWMDVPTRLVGLGDANAESEDGLVPWIRLLNRNGDRLASTRCKCSCALWGGRIAIRVMLHGRLRQRDFNTSRRDESSPSSAFCHRLLRTLVRLPRSTLWAEFEATRFQRRFASNLSATGVLYAVRYGHFGGSLGNSWGSTSQHDQRAFRLLLVGVTTNVRGVRTRRVCVPPCLR